MALPRSLPVVLLAALAAFAAPSQAAPPPDAFCVILFEGFDDLRLVRVTVDQETNLTEREELFGSLDLNRDGLVDTDEAEVLRSRTMEARQGTFSNETYRLGVAAENETYGNHYSPLHTAVWRQVGHTFHKQDHEQPWPVTEPVDLETQEVREASFSFPADVRLVRLEGGLLPKLPPFVAIEYVVVRAPPGWAVTEVRGQTYNGSFVQEANATEVDVPAFDTKSPYWISFERRDAPPAARTVTRTATQTVTHTVAASADPDGPRGTPGLAPAVLAFALAAAAAVALRRRL